MASTTRPITNQCHSCGGGGSIGITTWIHEVYLNGVKFARKWTPGARGKSSKEALTVGRRVDALIKEYATSGKCPDARRHGGRVAQNALAELTRAKIKLVDANVFLKVKDIRTHADAIGIRDGLPVVIELKTTTRPLDAYMKGYTAACSRQPTAHGRPNTEHVHHQLQLGWTTMAYRQNKGARHATGVIVIAAQDGATTVPLNVEYATPQRWAQLMAMAPVRTGATTREMPRVVKKWPGHTATAAVFRALGVKPKVNVHGGFAVQVDASTVAVALSVPVHKLTKKNAAEIRKATNALHIWAVGAAAAGWTLQPVPAAAKKRI